MTPKHGFQPQTSQPPFQIVLDRTDIEPGKTWNSPYQKPFDLNYIKKLNTTNIYIKVVVIYKNGFYRLVNKCKDKLRGIVA